jgi:hypothetical protein
MREWEMRIGIVGSRTRRKFDDEKCGTTDVGERPGMGYRHEYGTECETR